MAKRQPKPEKPVDAIIYQSPSIPDLKITQSQLAHLKQRFPDVTHFQPIILKAESWLLDPVNAGRFPKRLFTFICNWIDNEAKFEKERRQTAPTTGKKQFGKDYHYKPSARAKQDQEEYKFEKPGGTKIDILKDVHTVGDVLKQIAAEGLSSDNK